MSKGPSKYALKGGVPRLSAEYENFHACTQAGSGRGSEADHWRREHSKKFSTFMSFSSAQALHYSHKHGRGMQTRD